MKIEKVSIGKFFSVIKDGNLREKEIFCITLNELEDYDESIFHYHDPDNGQLVAIYHDISGALEGDYFILSP